MKRILVPWDSCTPSSEALKLSLDIAAKTTGQVVLLQIIYIPAPNEPHIYSAPVSPAQSNFFLEIDKKKVENKKKREPLSVIQTSIQITRRNLICSIKNIINILKIDLVVMGIPGASSLRSILISSMTERDVPRSLVPVLTVRDASHFDAIRKVLLPATLGLDQVELVQKIKKCSLSLVLTCTCF